jgi:putrescine:ornithine antiporter
VYVLYASGKDAVFGGMLVWAVSFLIWAFIGYRFTSVTRTRAVAAACILMGVFGLAPTLQAQQPSTTVERLRAIGKIKLGYRMDARPFSYRDESGQAVGYSIDLCRQVADAVKSEIKQDALEVVWVPLTAADRLQAVEQGQVDLLCGAETVTLSKRQLMAFSIPIFPGGIGALVRADAPVRLRDVLAGRGQILQPVWRANALQVLQSRSFTAVQGTTSEQWLAQRIKDLEVITKVAPVNDYEEGIRALVDRRSDAFFGDRAILLDAARRHAAARELVVIDRLFTSEPIALALARNDEPFRLFVDRALSRVYRSGNIGALYTRWFGEPDESAISFFKWNTLPE